MRLAGMTRHVSMHLVNAAHIKWGEHLPTLAFPVGKSLAGSRKTSGPASNMPPPLLRYRGSPQNKRYFLLLSGFRGRDTCSSAVAGQCVSQRERAELVSSFGTSMTAKSVGALRID